MLSLLFFYADAEKHAYRTQVEYNNITLHIVKNDIFLHQVTMTLTMLWYAALWTWHPIFACIVWKVYDGYTTNGGVIYSIYYLSMTWLRQQYDRLNMMWHIASVSMYERYISYTTEY